MGMYEENEIIIRYYLFMHMLYKFVNNNLYFNINMNSL